MAKNHNFWQILTFWGLLYRPPFTDEGQIWCAIADSGTRLPVKLCLDQGRSHRGGHGGRVPRAPYHVSLHQNDN